MTDALVGHLMRNAETKPFLDEYLGTPQEVKLLRKAKVRAITYSNQIEGNGWRVSYLVKPPSCADVTATIPPFARAGR